MQITIDTDEAEAVCVTTSLISRMIPRRQVLSVKSSVGEQMHGAIRSLGHRIDVSESNTCESDLDLRTETFQKLSMETNPVRP